MKRIGSLLLALALSLGMLTVSAAALEVEDNPWLGYSNAPVEVSTHTTEYGWKEPLYIFPAGTEFYVSGFTMADWTSLTAYDPSVVGDITFGSNYVFYSAAERYSPEPDKVFHLVVSDTMQGFDTYIKVDSGVAAPQQPEEPAEPVEQPSSWAAEQVNAAIAAGIVPESLRSQYTQATTRAEFCALAVGLYETVKGSEITERATFSDTDDVNVQKMAALGVVSGVGNGKFDPNGTLTREQAAAMLARLAEAVGKPLTAQAPTFADSASISAWASGAVGQVQGSGVMSGVGGNNFAPQDSYTREQSISTMLRLYELMK